MRFVDGGSLFAALTEKGEGGVGGGVGLLPCFIMSVWRYLCASIRAGSPLAASRSSLA